MDLDLFSALDIVILVATMLIPLVVGIYYGVSNKKTTEDLLVGSRQMSVFPVAASLMASIFSAVTFLGYPAEVYSYGIQIFQIAVVSVILTPLSVVIFVPFFYEMRLVSVYEYLERRFDSVCVRLIASLVFIFQQLVISALVLYAPSIALEVFLGLSPYVSIIGIGVAGTLYTSVGGLKAVVWTDTFQVVLMYLGIILILVKAVVVAGGVSRTYELAEEGGRLVLFDFSIDPFMRHNFFNFLFGYGVKSLFHPGTRQHEVQRYSSLPTLRQAKLSCLLSIPLDFMAWLITLLTGVALYAAYAGCDPVLKGQIKKADGLVPNFVIREMLDIPGALGIFTACLFSGVLSSYSSSLNGMVAVTWKDFLSRLPATEKMKERSRAMLSMLVGIMYGTSAVTLAFFAKNMGGLYQAAIVIFGPTSGVLGGVFILALFIPLANKQGAIGGMILGFSSTLYICINAMSLTIFTQPLPTNTNSCPAGSLNGTTSAFSKTTDVNEIDWPNKIFYMSYLLYPLFALLATVIGGVIVSLISRAIVNSDTKNDPKYFHPWIQKIYRSRTLSIGFDSATDQTKQFIHDTRI